MRLGKVIGNAVCVLKHERLNNIKMAIVQPTDPYGSPVKRPLIVADYLGSAVGQTVYWVENGTTISRHLKIKSVPFRGCIVGHVDSIDMKDKKISLKDQ